MNAFRAGLRFESWSLRRSLDDLQAFLLTPLFTLLLGGIVVSTGRRDLLPEAALGAALIGMWMLCSQMGGNIIAAERADGTFEALASTPAPLRLVVAGRVTVVAAVMLLALPEAWLAALALFQTPVAVPHPALFAAAAVMTLAGLHATATLFAALFVLARNAVIFQNALAYPVYLLGGLLVPVSVLPGWIQPAARVIFLSWGSDLLRASLRSGPVAGAGTGLLGLTVTVAVTGAIGQAMVGVMLRRSRVSGTMSLV
jgi:ABC-2 type transport system permease protein